MAAADNPMAESGSSERSPEMRADNPPGGNTPEPPSIFVKKEALGGKDWKVGDEIVFKFKAIDPESGDAELFYAPEKPGADHAEEPADAMTEMDKQFPAAPGSSEGTGGGY